MNRRAICRLFKIKRFQPICKNLCHFIHFLRAGVRMHKEPILDIGIKILSHGSFKNLSKPLVKLLQPLKQSLATTVWNVYQLISAAVIRCIMCHKLPTYEQTKYAAISMQKNRNIGISYVFRCTYITENHVKTSD